jgi:hypothetical protein
MSEMSSASGLLVWLDEIWCWMASGRDGYDNALPIVRLLLGLLVLFVLVVAFLLALGLIAIAERTIGWWALGIFPTLVVAFLIGRLIVR